jgi:hypothetical protein
MTARKQKQEKSAANLVGMSKKSNQWNEVVTRLFRNKIGVIGLSSALYL